MKNNPLELVDDLKVIRTIHSNKARLFGFYNFWYAIVTIIIAVIVTFIGFSGAENFAKLFTNEKTKTPSNQTVQSRKDTTSNNSSNLINQSVDTAKFDVAPASQIPDNDNDLDFKAKVKMIMDLMTLSILVISILGLILQFEKKANKHKSAILRLTELISDLAFSYTTVNPPLQAFREEDVKVYAEKYKALLNSLPSTSDKDYFSALKTIQSKKRKKVFIMSEEYSKMNLLKRRWKLLWM